TPFATSHHDRPENQVDNRGNKIYRAFPYRERMARGHKPVSHTEQAQQYRQRRRTKANRRCQDSDGWNNRDEGREIGGGGIQHLAEKQRCRRDEYCQPVTKQHGLRELRPARNERVHSSAPRTVRSAAGMKTEITE